MDGTLAVQDGLSEDGPSGVTSAHPDALHTPLGSPAPPDQWDEGASVEANSAASGGQSPDVPSKGDACQNGPTPQLPDPPSALGPSTSPMGPDAPPGSTEASLPLEKEEQIRLQARKRLEEQLKQYRVKRQQERVSPSPGQGPGDATCRRQR
uniref:Golgin A3 n=1 Tax=Rousettus aegyptiacus TaxID=9407 RepID=A0A7J8GZ23_ROUAE|nr:golgin A3 [Rousettus aegyptiacus]